MLGGTGGAQKIVRYPWVQGGRKWAEIWREKFEKNLSASKVGEQKQKKRAKMHQNSQSAECAKPGIETEPLAAEG